MNAETSQLTVSLDDFTTLLWDRRNRRYSRYHGPDKASNNALMVFASPERARQYLDILARSRAERKNLHAQFQPRKLDLGWLTFGRQDHGNQFSAMEPSMKKAVAYTRSATGDQVICDRQRDEINAKFGHTHEIVGEYRDIGTTGVGLKELLRDSSLSKTGSDEDRPQ